MSELIYVVNEVGYVYDGSIYVRPDCASLHPIVAYRDRSMAVADANRRIIETLRIDDLSAFCYDLGEMFPNVGNIARTFDILSHYGPCETMEEFDAVLKLASDDELGEISRLINLEFYEVLEVELTE